MLRQPGGPRYNRLNGRQFPAAAQLHQQGHPLPRVLRVPQHPLQRHGLACGGLHQVAVHAVLLQQGQQPLAQKFSQIVGEGLSVYAEVGQQLGPVEGTTLQQGVQVETPAPIPENLQQSLTGAAQGVGVGGARRPLSFGIDAQEQLQPFSKGQHSAGRGAGQAISCSPGQVVLQHSQGDATGLPLGQEVLAAHSALQFRELADHLAHQVVLAEVGGPAGQLRRASRELQLLEQHIGAPFQPFGALQQAAQSCGEGDAGELVAAVNTGHGAVGTDKELGIGKAGPQDPLIAAGHGGRRRGQAIADAEEAGQQAVAGI